MTAKKNDLNLHQLDEAALRAKEAVIRKDIEKARMEHVAGKLKDPASLLIMRKLLARVKTVQRELQLAKQV